MKKTRIKKASIIALIVLLISTGDLGYMLYNITFNATATIFGCITMVLDIIMICTSYDYLEKRFNKNN